MEWAGVIVAAALVLLPGLLYGALGGGTGGVWGFVAGREKVEGRGPYRERRERSWKKGRAPGVVRLAAFTSVLLGQVLIPASFATVVCLYGRGGLGVVGLALVILPLLPGLAAAAQVLGVGVGLLGRDKGIAADARKAARYAAADGVLQLLAVGGSLVLGRGAEPWLAISLAALALVTVGHAGLLARAARALDEYTAAQEAAGPPELS